MADLCEWQRDRIRRVLARAGVELKDLEMRFVGKDILYIDALRAAGFTDEEIECMEAIRAQLCQNCLDDFSGCVCRNDE